MKFVFQFTYKVWVTDSDLATRVDVICVLANRMKAARAIFKEKFPDAEIQSVEQIECLTQD